MMKTTSLLGAALVSVSPLLSTPALSQATDVVKLTFGNFHMDGLSEQDVFMENPDNKNEVKRIPFSIASGAMDMPLFSTTKEPPFEPMKKEPTATYPKGAALGINLGEWLAAKGTGTYQCDGQKATIKASFVGLIPNAVYTMWNFIDAAPPTEPYQSLVLPAGKRDGSQSIFNSDADGKGTYEAVIEPCPDLSGNQTAAGLAIAWHSDGKTYGFNTGGLGVLAHAQLMSIFPKASQISSPSGH